MKRLWRSFLEVYQTWNVKIVVSGTRDSIMKLINVGRKYCDIVIHQEKDRLNNLNPWFDTIESEPY